MLLLSKSQVLLSTATLLRISLSPYLFSRILWVKATVDYVCDFSSALEGLRTHLESVFPRNRVGNLEAFVGKKVKDDINKKIH
jgi:hypothetical protein